MGTVIRPEVSDKNPYKLEKHRYLELKQFCLQYPIWEEAYNSLTELSKHQDDLAKFSYTGEHSDPTARCAIAREYYAERINLVVNVAKEADADLWGYILRGVTTGHTYEYMRTHMNIPCCRNEYYRLYRKFFWILNRTRN